MRPPSTNTEAPSRTACSSSVSTAPPRISIVSLRSAPPAAPDGPRLPSDGGLAGAAARRLRAELLGEIELASSTLRRRCEDKRALPPLDEWREFVALRAAVDGAARLGGLELRRLAFPTLHPDACKLAVWLWNERKERAIAHEVFAWLLHQAQLSGDERAVELQAKNVACGVG